MKEWLLIVFTILVFLAVVAWYEHLLDELRKDNRQLRAELQARPRVIRRSTPQSQDRAPFCTDCPDHEACGTGYPCAVVKNADRDVRLQRSLSLVPAPPMAFGFTVDRSRPAVPGTPEFDELMRGID